jgi:WD40 repeat protein/tRNA A-37 threonylcarbamoyl transferase component Bud32
VNSDDQGTEKWSTVDPVPDPGRTPSDATAPGLSQIDLSHYDFDDVVGRGGEGIVIRARDRRLRRQVAIKLTLGRDPSMRARFEREALLTARLQHPGVVPIYEAGQWPNGESFYAMRLIEGQPLSDHIAGCTSLDERLALLPKVVGVMEAVAYAHTEHVIHRDLKPGNVVVGPFGEVMVVDWGLAKDLTQPDGGDPRGDTSTGAADRTVVGAVMGTPAYMSPEQASGAQVDERTDVYALGALLYHVLTGAPPFTGTGSADILQQVRQGAPEPIEVRQPGVPRDLAAIVGKAMERERSARYANAGELAADIKRFVTGQLVGAHRYSRRVLVLRTIRRHPVIAAVAAFAVVLLVLGAVAVRRIVAEQAATESRSRELLLGQARAMVETDPTAAVALLGRYPDLPAESPAVRAVALDAESRGVARHVLAGHTAALRGIAIAPDGKQLASTDADGAFYLWNAVTGERELLHQSTTLMDVVEFDPSGAFLAASLGARRGIVLWDRRARTKRVLSTEDDLYAIGFSPDGGQLAAGSSGGKIYLWTVATGEQRVLAEHAEWCSSVEFSPDGRRLLSTSQDGTARLWTLATGAAQVMPLDDQSYRGVFAPDGRSFAVGAVDGSVRIYAVDDPTAPVRSLRGDKGAVDFLAYSRDGRRLAWAGMGEAVYVADLTTWEIRALHGHQDDVTGMAFLADDTLVTASADGTLRHWDLATALAAVLRGHTDQIRAMAISKDGQLVASGSADRTVRVWAPPPAARTFAIKASRESDFAASPGNDILYFYQDGQALTALDLRTGAARTVATARPWARTAGNPAGTQVAYRDGQRRVAIIDLVTAQEHDLPVEAALVGRVLGYSPDGTTLVFPGWRGLHVVDTATRAVRELPYPSGVVGDNDPKVVQMQFAADGTRVLTVGVDVTIWALVGGAGAVIARPPLWPSYVVGSPDFATFAAGAVGGLDVHDGASWRRLLATERDVYPIVFSPDSKLLAAADDGGGLRIWRLADRAAAPMELVGHAGPLRRIEFSSDGTRLVSAGADGAVRLWDLATGQQLAAIRAHGGRAVEWAGFRGSELVTAGRDGAVRIWPAVTRSPGPVGVLLRGLTSFRGDR